MVPNTMDSTYMERNTDKVVSLGPMAVRISDVSKKTIFRDMVPITGLMEECSSDILRWSVCCMSVVSLRES